MHPARPHGSTWLSAAALVLAPVLLGVSGLLVPDGASGVPDGTRSGAVRTVAAVAESRSAWFAASVLAVLGAGLVAAGVLGLIRLARSRGATLATAGGGLAVVGAVCWVAIAAADGMVKYAVTASTVPRDAAVETWWRVEEAGVGVGTFGLAYLLLFHLGLVVLTVGLVRGRSVPAWQPVLATVAFVAAGVLPNGPASALAYAVLLVALTPLARALLRTERADAAAGGRTGAPVGAPAGTRS